MMKGPAINKADRKIIGSSQRFRIRVKIERRKTIGTIKMLSFRFRNQKTSYSMYMRTKVKKDMK
jgi:hypothetical protein